MNKFAHFLFVAITTAVGLSAQPPAPAGDAAQATLNTIFTRTSIRSWENRPVEPAKVETLLRAAMSAPTARNQQPWHFVVLDKREALDALAQGRGGGMYRKAPLGIVVCGNMYKAMEGTAREFWVQDASAATENILLAAHAIGLGGVWTGVYPISERVQMVQTALKLPATLVPLCVVLIGYPAEQPTPKDKWNPDNVTYNFGD